MLSIPNFSSIAPYCQVSILFEGYAKSCILNTLRNGIRTGSLYIIDGHESFSFGEEHSSNTADITVMNADFYVRIFTGHDLGFSEAYMHGDFETSSLKAILNLWLLNRAHLADLVSCVNYLSAGAGALALRLFGQNMSNAKLNVIAAYDCGNELFEAFLSEDMMYSCAIWSDALGGVRGDLDKGPFPGDLEAAQLAKLHYVLRKARVRPGARVLEFGTGWGAMAVEAAKMGCTVDTLTLSVQQKLRAEQRVRDAGLEGRVTVHLLDYRALPDTFKGAFDAFVSIEMVEHVGVDYHAQFFKIVDWALKKDRGAAVISATTTPEWRYSTFQTTDYARKYQWPNAFCPCPTAFVNAAHQAVPGRLALETVEDFGAHYPRTLREWGRRFEQNWSTALIAALLKHHPELSEPDNLAIFRRKWEYMFVYAEIGFACAYTSCHTFTFVRPEYVSALCA
ncbi:CFS1-like protein [Amylocystis lapponica]|nr:CFS1-like protein [Amylocystis lapponica]